ncbi:MAG: 4Fe-4S dicluster domain-containing protein [Candidatus Omnitrophica bacterium]|nr:4Fe-4S dicluster domain-containing protein [Candidatus Omnitrophota bacterium]
MAKIVITQDRCKGCFLCVSFCPKGLIRKSSKLNKYGIAPVKFLDKAQQCLGCSQCAIMCPESCIEVYR